MLYVVKRDGRKAEFNPDKISKAIRRAAIEEGLELKTSQIMAVVQKVINYIEMEELEEVTVEEIQNLVEKALRDQDYKNISLAYSNYRRERTKVRDIKSDLMKAIQQIGVETDRDNANVGNNFSSKL